MAAVLGGAALAWQVLFGTEPEPIVDAWPDGRPHRNVPAHEDDLLARA